MMQENLLRFVVTEDTDDHKSELVIEKLRGGRYYMRISDADAVAEIELTPGLLQELRRTMGKIA